MLKLVQPFSGHSTLEVTLTEAVKKGNVVLKAFQKKKDASMEKIGFRSKRKGDHEPTTHQETPEAVGGAEELPEIVNDVSMETICKVRHLLKGVKLVFIGCVGRFWIAVRMTIRWCLLL